MVMTDPIADMLTRIRNANMAFKEEVVVPGSRLKERIAQNANAQMERAREVLRDHEVRVASVRKLIERRAQELRLSAERIEQKQTDEFGARSAWNHPGLIGPGAARAA